MTDSELLTAREVEAWTKIPEATLAQWRYLGRHGPRYLKLGGHVRYRRSDVDAWLAEAARDQSA